MAKLHEKQANSQWDNSINIESRESLDNMNNKCDFVNICRIPYPVSVVNFKGLVRRILSSSLSTHSDLRRAQLLAEGTLHQSSGFTSHILQERSELCILFFGHQAAWVLATADARKVKWWCTEILLWHKQESIEGSDHRHPWTRQDHYLDSGTSSCELGIVTFPSCCFVLMTDLTLEGSSHASPWWALPNDPTGDQFWDILRTGTSGTGSCVN